MTPMGPGLWSTLHGIEFDTNGLPVRSHASMYTLHVCEYDLKEPLPKLIEIPTIIFERMKKIIYFFMVQTLIALGMTVTSMKPLHRLLLQKSSIQEHLQKLFDALCCKYDRGTQTPSEISQGECDVWMARRHEALEKIQLLTDQINGEGGRTFNDTNVEKLLMHVIETLKIEQSTGNSVFGPLMTVPTEIAVERLMKKREMHQAVKFFYCESEWALSMPVFECIQKRKMQAFVMFQSISSTNVLGTDNYKMILEQLVNDAHRLLPAYSTMHVNYMKLGIIFMHLN